MSSPDLEAFSSSEAVERSRLLALPEPAPEGHRSGIVCLAGRPNVGKSTLLNAMVGSKIAIVTPVPGTTRNVIRGVVTRDDAQLVFVDTPGVAKPRSLLSRRLNDLVHRTWHAVDAVCFLVDGAAGIGRGDEFIAGELRGSAAPVVLVVNKQDALGRDAILPVLERAATLGDWPVVPTSATTGANVDHLIDVLVELVPEGPRLFPRGVVTDQPERQLAAEIIREKFLVRVSEEVPHSIAVVVDELEWDDELLRVTASVFVERDSQKGIVIGKGGHVLREANTRAREELEALFAAKVFLDVHVKVAPGWQRDPRRLERFGY